VVYVKKGAGLEAKVTLPGTLTEASSTEGGVGSSSQAKTVSRFLLNNASNREHVEW